MPEIDLQTICARTIRDTEGVLACLLLDLSTGLALAQAPPPDETSSVNVQRLAMTADEVFCGAHLARFAQALQPDRETLLGFVREVQVATAKTHQFLSAVTGHDHIVLVLITRKTVSIGLGWMCVHHAESLLADALNALSQKPSDVQSADEPLRQEEKEAPAIDRAPVARQIPPPDRPIPPSESPAPPLEPPLDQADGPTALEQNSLGSGEASKAAKRDPPPLVGEETPPPSWSEHISTAGRQRTADSEPIPPNIAPANELPDQEDTTAVSDAPASPPLGPRARMFATRSAKDKARSRH